MDVEAFVSVFLDKVAYLLIEEAESLRAVRDQVQWIQREMRQMYSFLGDAREKEFRDVRVWIADIQQTTYDAEDLIDTFIFQKSQQRRRKTFFKRYSLIFHDLLALHKFAKEMKRIQTNIRSISDRRLLTHTIENVSEERGVGPMSSAESYLQEQRPTSPQTFRMPMLYRLLIHRTQTFRMPISSAESYLREQHPTSPRSFQTVPIVGLSKDVELLEKRLIHGDNLRRSVVSIIGKSGLGKTTLARTIYNSDIVRRHFDCFVWIYVSKKFQLEKILYDIEKQLKRSSGQETVSANEVEVSLFHPKYLIVLDDVSTTDVWTRLEQKIPDNVNGSKIILTSCHRHIGLHADVDPHVVLPLNEQDAWTLFTHITFKGKNCFNPDLNEFRRNINDKCLGVPLAIILVGRVLCKKNENFIAWSRFFRNRRLNLYTSALGLIYYDLPAYLKQCFLYFGIIPAKSEIFVKRLIRLWIAEGFVHPRGEEELEDIGKDYIEELVDRNIIQLTYRKENVHNIRSSEMGQKAKNGKPEGRRLTCSMHGFVRDLSISIGKENSFLEVYANEIHDTSYTLAKARLRRLAVYFDSEKSPSLNQNIIKITSLKPSTPKLHSLLLFDLREGETQCKGNGNFHLQSILDRSFLFLKVLDLEGTYKPRLPKALGKLIHLRYLGLRCTSLDKLPSSVADLFNLQTLDLICTELQVIPQGIWGMEHLRHLYLDGGAPSRVITGINDCCSLRNLRTLYGIFVGEENCVKRKLNMLTKIRKLGIEGDLISQGEELADWIASLHRLEHLKLKSTVGELKLEPSRDWERPYWSLNKLHLEGKITFFPNSPALLSGLTKLTLIGTLKESDPMRELGLLENLRILRLCYNSYVGRSMICSSGEFPKLEVLVVSWLEELEEWVVEEGAMPNLSELEINKCNKLIQLPGGLKFLNNLKELRLPAISNALKSRVLPYTGEDWSKIQHIPLISPPLCNDAAPTTASTSSSSRRPTL